MVGSCKRLVRIEISLYTLLRSFSLWIVSWREEMKSEVREGREIVLGRIIRSKETVFHSLVRWFGIRERVKRVWDVLIDSHLMFHESGFLLNAGAQVGSFRKHNCVLWALIGYFCLLRILWILVLTNQTVICHKGWAHNLSWYTKYVS